MKIKRLSQVYQESKYKLLINILNKTDDDLLKTVAMDPNTLKGGTYQNGDRRVGNVRQNWLVNTLEDYWNHIKVNFESIKCL